MDVREFENPYPDFSHDVPKESLLGPDGSSLNSEWQERIEKQIKALLSRLEHGLETQVDFSDVSVYTGTSGITLLFYKLHQVFGSENVNWLDRASQLLTKSEKAVHGHKPSFLCGVSGPLACRAVVSCRQGDPEKSKQAIKSLVKLADFVVEDSELPDELLFGRAGYLYALMFVTREVDREAVSGEVITQVVDAIVCSGKKLASQVKSSCPLMYMWHESYYLGAAHGLAGIFFQLMRSPMIMSDPSLRHMVEQSLEYLMKLRLPSGNYPSSLHSREKDKLVHWCHGAPGFLHVFLQAFEVYGKETYIIEAQSCAEVIWKRGILRKGYGLCHGVAGNGYGFLMLYKQTQNLKYLYRALKFAEWIFGYGTHGCRTPDHPYSLFEGVAGTIYFLVDLLKPNEAAFPAFY